MLSVRSAKLHRRLSDLPAPRGLSFPLVCLQVAPYPQSAQSLRLICAIQVHSIGVYSADLGVLTRVHGRVAYRGRPHHLMGGVPGLPGDLILIDELQDLVFTGPDTYDFEILIDGDLEYSLDLLVP